MSLVRLPRGFFELCVFFFTRPRTYERGRYTLLSWIDPANGPDKTSFSRMRLLFPFRSPCLGCTPVVTLERGAPRARVTRVLRLLTLFVCLQWLVNFIWFIYKYKILPLPQTNFRLYSSRFALAIDDINSKTVKNFVHRLFELAVTC